MYLEMQLKSIHTHGRSVPSQIQTIRTQIRLIRTQTRMIYTQKIKSLLSPFTSTQPLLDSCHIEGKYCSRIHGTLATCISFHVLQGITDNSSSKFHL